MTALGPSGLTASPVPLIRTVLSDSVRPPAAELLPLPAVAGAGPVPARVAIRKPMHLTRSSWRAQRDHGQPNESCTADVNILLLKLLRAGLVNWIDGAQMHSVNVESDRQGRSDTVQQLVTGDCAQSGTDFCDRNKLVLPAPGLVVQVQQSIPSALQELNLQSCVHGP